MPTPSRPRPALSGAAAAGLLAAFVLLSFAKGGKIYPVALVVQGLLLFAAAWRLFAGALPSAGLLPPLLLLGFAQCLSCAGGGSLEGPLLSLGRFWMAPAFCLLAWDTWKAPHWSAFKGFVVAAALMQVLLWMPPFFSSSPALDLLPGNRQYGAFWVVMAFFVCAGWEELPAAARRGLLAALAAGVFLSMNRSAAAAWSVGVFFLFGRRLGVRRGFFAVAALAAFFLLFPPLWSALLRTDDPLAWKRLDIWGAAVPGILDRPWFGWGPGRFERLYQMWMLPQDAAPVRFDHGTLFAHNDFFQLAAYAGVPALAAFLWLWARLKTVSGPAAWMPAAAVFCLFNFPLALPVNVLLLGGMAASSLPAPGFRSGPRLARVLCAFLVLLGCVAFWRWPGSLRAGPPERVFYGASADDLSAAESLMEEPSLRETALALVARSLSKDPGRAEAWRTQAALVGRTGTPADAGLAAASLRRAVELRPRNALWWLELGLWSERAGRPADAAEALHAALRVEPRFAEASFHLGRLMIARGETDKARRWLEHLRDAPPPRLVPWASPYSRRIVARDAASLSALLAECQRRKR